MHTDQPGSEDIQADNEVELRIGRSRTIKSLRLYDETWAVLRLIADALEISPATVVEMAVMALIGGKYANVQNLNKIKDELIACERNIMSARSYLNNIDQQHVAMEYLIEDLRTNGLFEQWRQSQKQPAPKRGRKPGSKPKVKPPES